MFVDHVISLTTEKNLETLKDYLWNKYYQKYIIALTKIA